MKGRRSFLSFALLALLGAARSASAETLADRLPEDVVLYAAFEDPSAFRAGARQTALGKTWREEEVQAVRPEIRKLLEKDADDEVLPFLKGAWGLLRAPVSRCEIAAWVDRAGPGKTCLRAAAAVASEDGKSLRAAIEGGLSSLIRGETTVEKRPDGARWRGRGGEVLLTERGGICFLTAVAADGLGDLRAGELPPAAPDKPLSRSALFVSVRQGLGGPGGGCLAAFLNLDSLKRWLVREPDLARELALEPELLAFARTLGLDRVQAAGLSLAPEGEGFRSRFHLHASWASGTLPAVLAGAGRGPFRSFDRLPAQALVASAARIPWEALWKAGETVAAGIPSEDARELRDAVAAIERGASLRILGDLLPALGEETAFCLGKPSPGLIPIPPMTFLVEVKDPKKVEACLAKIADYASSQGAPHAKTPYGGRILYHFGGGPGRGDPFGMLFQPAFVVTETHLVASSSPQVLKTLLSSWKRPDFTGVAGTDRFKKARERLSPDAHSAAYVDFPELVTFLYNTVLQFAGVARGLGGEEAPFNMNALPSAEVLTRHLTASVESVEFRADGIRASSWSPVGVNLSGLDPATVSGLAGLGWIQGARSRRESARWTCQSHLQQLGMRIAAHEAEHGAPPKRIEDIEKAEDDGMWVAAQFYCPLDPGHPEGFQPQGGREWIAAHPPSYRYVRGRKGADGGVVRLYEKEPRHGGKRHVFFADGSVDLVDEARFKELADTQGFLAPPKPPLPPTPEVLRQIDEKVKDLAADDFTRREAATEWLAAVGPAAVPAVKRAAADTDPEVRSRARRILEEIE